MKHRRALFALAALQLAGGHSAEAEPPQSMADLGPAERAEVGALAGDYARYLDEGKLPPFLVSNMVREAEGLGFRSVDLLADADPPRAEAGARLAIPNRGSTLLLVRLGRRPVSEGLRFIGTHIDTPCLKLLPGTLNEKNGTLGWTAAGYGGLKGYQWEHLPLAIWGVVHRKGGEEVRIRLGPEQGHAFVVHRMGTDAKDKGGALERAWKRNYRVLLASVPSSKRGVRKGLRYTFLSRLREEHGLVEADLEAAQLFAVPARGARDVGLDRAAIGSFGHDDRACSFAAYRAILGMDQAPERTAAVMLTDKEEIGSTGAVGARSRFVELATAYLLRATGEDGSERAVRATLEQSKALSGDVAAALNPLFPDVHDPLTAARFGGGPAAKKFTGSGGKMRGSDAHPELVAEVRRIFHDAGVPLQVSVIGKVDEGGGGTIAKFLAHKGMDVMDVGMPILSMHAPFEVAHKFDLWTLERGYRAFLEAP